MQYSPKGYMQMESISLLAQSTTELTDRGQHAGMIKINTLDDLEALLLQCGCYIVRVIHRVIEDGGVLVGRISNDQCNAACTGICVCRRGQQYGQANYASR